jgi:hypothetical protein
MAAPITPDGIVNIQMQIAIQPSLQQFAQAIPEKEALHSAVCSKGTSDLTCLCVLLIPLVRVQGVRSHSDGHQRHASYKTHVPFVAGHRSYSTAEAQI